MAPEMIEQTETFTTGGERIADYIKPTSDTKPAPSPGQDTDDDGGEPAVIDPRGIALRNPEEIRALIDHVMTLPADQRRKSAYWSPDHPNHNAAVAEMQHLYRVLDEREQAPKAADEVTQSEQGIEDLRRFSGVSVPDGLSTQFQQWWTAGPFERMYLDWVVSEHIPANIAQRAADFYAERMILGDGKLTDEDLEDFRTTFKGKLTDAQIAELERWYSEELTRKR